MTHPHKLLWRADGITKLGLAQYYARVAPVLLRYVQDRPITLRPFPRGVEQPGFYLKNAPKGAPPWVETFADVAESTGEEVRFVVARDARTLVWVAQFNGVEIHPWLSRVDLPDSPDWAVVDLDPAGEPDAAGWRQLVARENERVGQRLDVDEVVAASQMLDGDQGGCGDKERGVVDEMRNETRPIAGHRYPVDTQRSATLLPWEAGLRQAEEIHGVAGV